MIYLSTAAVVTACAGSATVLDVGAMLRELPGIASYSAEALLNRRIGLVPTFALIARRLAPLQVCGPKRSSKTETDCAGNVERLEGLAKDLVPSGERENMLGIVNEMRIGCACGSGTTRREFIQECLHSLGLGLEVGLVKLPGLPDTEQEVRDGEAKFVDPGAETSSSGCGLVSAAAKEIMHSAATGQIEILNFSRSFPGAVQQAMVEMEMILAGGDYTTRLRETKSRLARLRALIPAAAEGTLIADKANDILKALESKANLNSLAKPESASQRTIGETISRTNSARTVSTQVSSGSSGSKTSGGLKSSSTKK